MFGPSCHSSFTGKRISYSSQRRKKPHKLPVQPIQYHPKRGPIIRGAFWSAFSRGTLGSGTPWQREIASISAADSSRNHLTNSAAVITPSPVPTLSARQTIVPPLISPDSILFSSVSSFHCSPQCQPDGFRFTANRVSGPIGDMELAFALIVHSSRRSAETQKPHREISRCVSTRKPRVWRACAATSESSMLRASADRPPGRFKKLYT